MLEKLNGIRVFAHNAKFEESFLTRWFQEWGINPIKTHDGCYFHDSLEYLMWTVHDSPRLGLEYLLKHYFIHGSEKHRGLSDALDMAKVMIAATLYRRSYLSTLHHEDEWFNAFYAQPIEQLEKTLLELVPDFDLKKIYPTFAKEALLPESKVDIEKFALENHWSMGFTQHFMKLMQMFKASVTGFIQDHLTAKESLALTLWAGFIHAKKFGKSVHMVSWLNEPQPLHHNALITEETLTYLNKLDRLTSQYFSQIMQEDVYLSELKESSYYLSFAKEWERASMALPPALYKSRLPDLTKKTYPFLKFIWKVARSAAFEEISKEGYAVLMGLDECLESSQSAHILSVHQAHEVEWQLPLHGSTFAIEDLKYICCLAVDPLYEEIYEAVRLSHEKIMAYTQIIEKEQTDTKIVFFHHLLSSRVIQELNLPILQSDFLFLMMECLKNTDTLINPYFRKLESWIVKLQKNSIYLCWYREKGNECYLFEQSTKSFNLILQSPFYENISELEQRYLNYIYGLDKMPKEKRFSSIQLVEEKVSPKLPELVFMSMKKPFWSQLPLDQKEVVFERLWSWVTPAEKNKILYWGSQWEEATQLFYYLQQKSRDVAHYREYKRGHGVEHLFIWERIKNAAQFDLNWSEYSSIVIDKISDISWGGLSQYFWKKRLDDLQLDRFNFYWERRASIFCNEVKLMTKFSPQAKIFIVDPKAMKWKGATKESFFHYLKKDFTIKEINLD
jgi:hypothetical protein